MYKTCGRDPVLGTITALPRRAEEERENPWSSQPISGLRYELGSAKCEAGVLISRP